jgi:hypothetical protein
MEVLPFNSDYLRQLADQMHLYTEALFAEERLIDKIREIDSTYRGA